MPPVGQVATRELNSRIAISGWAPTSVFLMVLIVAALKVDNVLNEVTAFIYKRDEKPEMRWRFLTKEEEGLKVIS